MFTLFRKAPNKGCKKRGLFLGLALLLVLGITTALFAYEYLEATGELPTLPSIKWAVTEELPGPDWPTVLHQNMGEVPQGKLFTITPCADYSGDLVVNVYLTNVGVLSRAYRYLNMKIYVEESVEAAMTPSYHVLTLDNGVATFHLEGLAANSHLVSVIGGSYSLIPADPLMEKEDWAITPEFYCEVNPR